MSKRHSENIERVLAFIAAFRKNDLDEIMRFFAPDCVYHNMPLAPVTGAAAIRATLLDFTKLADEMEWVLHHIAETESGVVLTERTDRFRIQKKWVELPVMGSFEVHDGVITAWRDYFDMQQFQKQLPR